ncbi:MAG: winged helix-turn-helix domain-containing protein [Acidobacteriia bacterium]|nr:winged helix-turn-helix domain-containing protein [Terriglobia bacterium]
MDLVQTAAIYAERYQDSHLVVDFERETAYLDGTPMKLTAKAFSLLGFLVRHPGQLVPRETLLMLVWGYGEEIRTRTLDVHIRRLRKSFGKFGTVYIETIFGVGYRFQPCRNQAKVQASAASSVVEMDSMPASWRWKMEPNPAY